LANDATNCGGCGLTCDCCDGPPEWQPYHCVSSRCRIDTDGSPPYVPGTCCTITNCPSNGC
jgi:hypothetical protein